ncbi:MAG: carbamoyltransferase HypF [Anaerolineales bacterium]|nr:carbamoyltransferase HypF [Anaerolineales bacterium]
MNERQGARIHITGIVQGVGFRPFVYGLAARLGLAGWVRNTSAGVDIEVDGVSDALHAFVAGLRTEAPPLSNIDSLTVEILPAHGFTGFEIVHSRPVEGAFQPISPDVCICPDCLRELRDPADRRYHYPFINCTNCGPRFTIITDIPYDRPNTTMASFALCADCAREYADPLDRRFHAQPVACPACGPKIWLEESKQGESTVEIGGGQRPADSGHSDEVIYRAQMLLKQGRILAIKGLGGFHLACDAAYPQAVDELRRRKLRVDKPFALMMPDLQTVAKHCTISATERSLLESRQRPIVVLKRRPESPVAEAVAPRQDTLGVMLPYTPLHYLLFEPGMGAEHFVPVEVLVMTSGNLSEEPIATDNEEARNRLSPLAEALLMHDRPIRTRCDDSVVRVVALRNQRPAVLHNRRSRGYAPTPILIPWEAPVVLACGTELKNTFCITRDRYAFLSHHVGDMQNYETLQSFQDGIDHFERLFRLKPEAVACDLHPDYLATRYAVERSEREGLPLEGIQHHHAHVAACMADNGLPPGTVVIGVAFDGTGYGTDGAIWGGEFLLAGYGASPECGIDRDGFRRMAHLAYLPLPGGDAAIRLPGRIALAYLWKTGLGWETPFPSMEDLCAEDRHILKSQLAHNLNTPLTSSMGRLFDAAASLAGVRQAVNYEAQAAIEFEALADADERGAYRFDFRSPGESGALFQVDPAPVLEALVKDVGAGVSRGLISARFHNGIARMVAEACSRLRQETGVAQVALSGGVWQNVTLLQKSVALLEGASFTVYIHQHVPANDGGVAFGQALVAGTRTRTRQK